MTMYVILWQFRPVEGRESEFERAYGPSGEWALLFRRDDGPVPKFTKTLSLDLGKVEPSLAGPKRPEDRVTLAEISQSFRESFPQRQVAPAGGAEPAPQ